MRRVGAGGGGIAHVPLQDRLQLLRVQSGHLALQHLQKGLPRVGWQLTPQREMHRGQQAEGLDQHAVVGVGLLGHRLDKRRLKRRGQHRPLVLGRQQDVGHVRDLHIRLLGQRAWMESSQQLQTGVIGDQREQRQLHQRRPMSHAD